MSDGRYQICLVILAIVVLFNLPVPAELRIKSAIGDDIAPWQNVYVVVRNAARRGMSSLSRARILEMENSGMRETIVNLMNEIHDLQGLEKENLDLRKHLDFQKRSKRELVMCQVINRGGISGWWQTVTLDRGSSSGIRENRPVITMNGLIGLTTRVSENTSQVLLLIDPGCSIACKVSRTGSLGIVRGEGVKLGGDPDLEMLWPVKSSNVRYMDKNDDLKIGDEVVTSGLGGVYPEGILIGHLVNFHVDKSGLYQCAELEIAEDLRKLKYVFVLK